MQVVTELRFQHRRRRKETVVRPSDSETLLMLKYVSSSSLGARLHSLFVGFTSIVLRKLQDKAQLQRYDTVQGESEEWLRVESSSEVEFPGPLIALDCNCILLSCLTQTSFTDNIPVGLAWQHPCRSTFR